MRGVGRMNLIKVKNWNLTNLGAIGVPKSKFPVGEHVLLSVVHSGRGENMWGDICLQNFDDFHIHPCRKGVRRKC